MQLARQLPRESDVLLRTSSAPEVPTAQDGKGAPSPARELQAALQKAFDPAPEAALVAPEPYVRAWPAWAKLAVLTSMTALSWVAVISLAKILVTD